jgi:hypothetical protein
MRVAGIRRIASWPRRGTVSAQIEAIDHQVEIADNPGAADRGRLR